MESVQHIQFGETCYWPPDRSVDRRNVNCSRKGGNENPRFAFHFASTVLLFTKLTAARNRDSAQQSISTSATLTETGRDGREAPAGRNGGIRNNGTASSFFKKEGTNDFKVAVLVEPCVFHQLV
jgi:hypothetical protein